MTLLIKLAKRARDGEKKLRGVSVRKFLSVNCDGAVLVHKCDAMAVRYAGIPVEAGVWAFAVLITPRRGKGKQISGEL
ncbi:hypothetical protein [Paraburkholderia sp. BL6669N2]|uniref:hypothetical protein n=1 Tax=Paraburkholderia sp. BL6669N2 TaxID=1938807 RepID=UPI000E259DEC|nr:hypothetical protein [Paraburkholderia sp. BL6669N2]